MLPMLLGHWINSQLWYSIPIVVSISLVYGATRHEYMGPILHHALRTGLWIIGFMVVIIAILLFVSWIL